VLRLAAGHPAEALSRLDLADGVPDARARPRRAIALRELGRAGEAAPILAELAAGDDPASAERARELLGTD
jgi:hypothetical protein